MMDLDKHFTSYRNSLLAGALDECTWYSKQIGTKSPKFPTVFDYLSTTLEAIKGHIASGNEARYRANLMHHQTAMIHLFEAMVADVLWDYKFVGHEDIMALIDEYGINWFKFCRRSLSFKVRVRIHADVDIVWIPRYVAPWDSVEEGRVRLDADELYVLAQHKGRADSVLQIKLLHPDMKLTGSEKGIFEYKEPHAVNTQDFVHDWASPLFGEKQ